MPPLSFEGKCPGSGRMCVVVEGAGFCSVCHRWVWTDDTIILTRHDHSVPQYGDLVTVDKCYCADFAKRDAHNGQDGDVWRPITIAGGKFLSVSLRYGQGPNVTCLAKRWTVKRWLHPESHPAASAGSQAGT